MELVGKTVRREFEGLGFFSGTVRSYDSTTGFFEIVYEDGDSEELEFSEIAALLEGIVGDQIAAPEVSKEPVGRKPKKRRRFEIRGGSGNDSANLLSSICLNHIADEIQKKDGTAETLEEELGVGEKCEDTVLMNRNADINHSLNLNDELNLNDGVVSDHRLDLNVELNLNDGVNLNESDDMEKSKLIDLNLDLNDEVNGNSKEDDLGGSVLDSGKIERCFDLNLGLDDENKNLDAACDGQLKKITSSQMAEETLIREMGGNAEGMQIEGGSVNGLSKEVHFEIDGGIPVMGFSGSTENMLGDVIQKEDGDSPRSLKRNATFGVLDANIANDSCSPENQLKSLSDAGTLASQEYQGNSGFTGKGRNSRKRRKLSETVLRRSTRRGSAAISAQIHVSSAMELDSVNDELPSPAVSAVSEEKFAVSSPEEAEERNSLSPKPQLPPSSENLNLDGIPILGLFSVYSFLRSFSTLLFLSPFELEDFVTALRCRAPNLLFDFIHVSLLQTLRKHLEFLSVESSESASLCLRGLNWDLLDLITWPIFMVEYLLMHSSGLNPGFDLCHLKLFESDYYEQSESVKIGILQCLCDDVIEVEAIRSELNRRMVGTETNMDFDRSMKFDISKKRRVVMDAYGSSCLNEDFVAEAADWNSDECHLCKMDGNLICCDGCPAAFHSRCVGVAASLLPEGDWYCPECVIDKDSSLMRVGKSIRGAELLGIDPYGRLYYSSCGYLLVSDSCDTGSLFNYYHRDDLSAVIEALRSSYILYGRILSAITKLRNVTAIVNGAKCDMDSKNPTPMLPLPVVSSENCIKDETSNEGNPDERYMGNVNHSMKMENPVASSEGSAEISQAVTAIQNLEKTSLDCSDRSAGILSTKDMSQGQCRTSYVNYYSFARIASSVAEELTRKSSDKISNVSTRSVEEMLSAQVKVISNMPREFCWSNIQNLNVDARKEKCGWCFSCKVPDDDGESDCLFAVNGVVPVLESFTSELLGIRSRRNRKGHLIDVMCQILFMEDRLRGLLLGPWLNPHYSQLWRESVLKASSVASVKHLLLMLESNLRGLSLSAEWLKHVDTVTTVGSASHIVNRLSSKHGISRKRSKFSDLEPNSSANSASGLCLFWWRGGRISRHLFNWKVLPRSLVSKAARQGGCKKIPGILYPDSSEFAKRSKNVTWRASVETSRSVEQLALQVRELDANIRWDDIENTKLISKMDKESMKSFRSFKKVIVRRKCSEGKVVKYLLDFGKRRFIPDIVTKHGSMLEESSSGRKKYWLEESHVPLHLLKIFEEKRIARKSNKISSGKLLESGIVRKKPFKKRGFSYLFSKAERSENYQCGHCKKDVLIRDAVSCQYCKGFFHKRHAKKSAGAIIAECTYTCRQCQLGKYVKVDIKKGKSKLQKSTKVKKVTKQMLTKISKKSGKDKQPEQSQNNRKDIVVVPLRRSARKMKFVPVQSKKIGGRKRGRPRKISKKPNKPKKPKKGTWKKKRTLVYHTYWLNGLWLSKKPNDERVLRFKNEKLLFLSEQLNTILEQPKCGLCYERQFTPTLTYIGCEICGDWFHGDAFGLNAENVSNLIGFKCHKCRNRTPPVCPHFDAMTSDEFLLGGSKEAIVHQKSNSDGKSKKLLLTDESSH